MGSVSQEIHFLGALFSPADLVAMLVLVGTIRVLGDDDERITLRDAFGILIVVGLVMAMVRGAMMHFGAPAWAYLAAYGAIWWAAMVQQNMRPLYASVAVACLVAVSATGVFINTRGEQRLLRQLDIPAAQAPSKVRGR